MQGTTSLALRVIVLAVTALVFSASVESGAVSPSAPAPSRSGVVITAPAGYEPVITPPRAAPGRVVGASAEEQALVAWARERFAHAGLTFPEVDIHFHPRREDCHGLAGYAASTGEAPTEIHLCTERQPGSLVSRRVLLHELAHAWATANVDVDARGAFLTLRGLASWDAPDTPWELKGTEQAAEIMTWALLDEAIRVVAIPDADPDRLAAGYRVLTGNPPPRLP